MNIYEKKIRVVQADLDELDHVNNVRYVQWIQDISKEHWEHIVPKKIRADMIWVVRRHEIVYKLPSFLDDSLVIKTYILKNQGFISTRIVEFFDAKTKRLKIKGSTDWCLLHGKTGKPIPISEEIHILFETQSP
ncbi:MAG: thioesterase [Flavobacteriaceae bacterium]|nr:thioesterase [Flavobacteriaceae bacterium]